MKPSSDITKSVLSNNGGNSLEARMPKKAVHALELMAQGTSWRKVREATGISFAGQAGLKARNGKVLQKRREQMAVDGFETAEKIRMLLSEKLQQLSDDGEALSKTNLKDLVLSRAIEQDKAFAAIGENVLKVEHVKKGPSLEDAARWVEEMKKAAAQGSIDVEEVA